MFDFRASSLIAGVIFSIIGFTSFSYGRKLQLWKPIVIGLLLMTYSWFTPNLWLNWAVGLSLCVLLWFHHDE